MKKRMILLALFLTIGLALPANAQWQLGGVLTFNRASISVDPKPSSEEYSSRVVLGIGGVADKALTENIILHLEPMYLKKGSTFEERGDKANFNLSYFEIPVMIKYQFKNEANIKPYAMAGPTIGLLLGAELASTIDDFKQDAKDETKGIDFGLAFGGGINIPRGKTTFFAELRYVLGLTNINDVEGESTVKNRGIQLLGGLTVPVGE